MTSFADLSHHQGVVDLAAYARAGHDRIAFKATEGAAYVDPVFASRWRQAGTLGLARIAYHFAQAEGSGGDQFDHLLAAVTAAGGLRSRDALCLDIEDDDSAMARAHADEFCREFTARAVTRRCPVGLVYTGRWYAEPNNIRADDVVPGWRRLWVSDYGTAADSAIRLPSGWSWDQVVARQFTSGAVVPGVSGRCDCSRVLADWAGAAAPAVEPEDDMANADDVIVALTAQNARLDGIYRLLSVGDAPDAGGADKGTHPFNLEAVRAQLADVQAAMEKLADAVTRLQPAVGGDLQVAGTLRVQSGTRPA